MARLSGMNVAMLEADSPMDEIGLDSLMILDLVHWIRSELGVALELESIGDSSNPEALAQKILERIR